MTQQQRNSYPFNRSPEEVPSATSFLKFTARSELDLNQLNIARRGYSSGFAVFYPYAKEYGGIERNILALADYVYAEMGQKLILVTFECEVPELLESPRIQHVQIGSSSNYLSRIITLRIKLSQISLGFPILTFGQKGGFFLFLSGCSNYILHYTDPPSLLSSFRDRRSFLRRFFADLILRMSVRSAIKLLTMTKTNASELEHLYKLPFDVIYQGGQSVPNMEVSHDARISWQSNTFNILSVCRLQKSKNIDWAIQASAHLADKLSSHHIDVNLTVVGEGDEFHALSKQADQFMIVRENLNIYFTGFIDQVVLDECYAQTSMAVVPARQGYGLPVLEAAYRGIPVVLSVESRVSEILENDPFFKISEHDQASFVESVTAHALSILDDRLPYRPTSQLPTELSWAAELVKLWISFKD